MFVIIYNIKNTKNTYTFLRFCLNFLKNIHLTCLMSFGICFLYEMTKHNIVLLIIYLEHIHTKDIITNHSQQIRTKILVKKQCQNTSFNIIKIHNLITC